MTRYRVQVSDELLAERDHWIPVAGFRFISAERPGMAGMTICIFEDDDAPPELEGELVEPVFTDHGLGIVTIDGRPLASPPC